MPEFLEIRDVSKVFASGWIKRSSKVALEGLSLVIKDTQPSITTLVGESGSGKTTLARIILGFIRPTTGRMLYKGVDLWKLSGQERRQFRKDVQAIFQDPFEVFNPFYKVDHSLALPARKFKLANSRKGLRALIEETISSVGLHPEDTLGRYPHQLSGGQRQRVMIARALLMKPKLIIADEPVSMLDASLRATILENLETLNRDFGISILYITHDLTTAYEISRNIIVLYQGRVAEIGDIEGIIRKPEHPYTQLLMGSIPVPDPDKKWAGIAASQDKLGPGADDVQGCKFSTRCPFVMDVCKDVQPPLYMTAPKRLCACYLFEGAPTGEMTDVEFK